MAGGGSAAFMKTDPIGRALINVGPQAVKYGCKLACGIVADVPAQLVAEGRR